MLILSSLIISIISHSIYTIYQTKKNLHIVQLNSYKNIYYIKWLKKNLTTILNIKHLIPLITFIPLYLSFELIANTVFTLFYLFLFFTKTISKEKKPLVFTKRAKRLFLVNIILLLIIYWTIVYINVTKQYEYLGLFFTTLILLTLLSPILMIVSNLIITPIDAMVNKWYYQDAKKIIKKLDALTKIGITGSYGKTSTKHFLYDLLHQNFNTLITPLSYNTPMGTTKTIRESLKPIHKIFVSEMGAKRKGDIKELCDLVSPQIGLLTSIGEQHLETFKTLENIKKTKFELIESLPSNGIAFFNLDDPNIKELCKNTKVKSIYYGIKPDENLHYFAKDIQITPNGSSFVVYKHDGTNEIFHTKLLGKHNILNILAAISVACELGIDLKSLVPLVKNIKQVQNRLELKITPQGITIINDAFNSNPQGFKSALEVMKEMPSKKKILVTPGMIELGYMEYELNRSAGLEAVKVCDFIILVGTKQTKPIQDAINDSNYPKNNYYIAKDLNDACLHLNKIIELGDIILFENDLTDDYNERH